MSYYKKYYLIMIMYNNQLIFNQSMFMYNIIILMNLYIILCKTYYLFQLYYNNMIIMYLFMSLYNIN